jgi:flagellin
MIINTNISSLTAQEAAKNTNSTLSSSLEKLSTGLKINKASDDASGLAIADKLRTQVTSINQAVSNGNSAVSLLQIADKSMSEQSTILDTIKAKLIQASTDTTSDDGRAAIAADIGKLLTQFDSIAEQTNYNGTNLLNTAKTLNFQMGEKDTYDVSVTTTKASNTSSLGGTGSGAVTTVTAGQSTSVKQTAAGAGGEIDITTTATSGGTTIAGKMDAITVGIAGNTLKANDSATQTILDAAVNAGTLTSSGSGLDTIYTAATPAVAINLGGAEVNLTLAATGAGTVSVATSSNILIKNGDNTNDLTIANATASSNLNTIKLDGTLTSTDANSYMGIIDQSLTELNTNRSAFGSTQNQVESAVRNLMTQSTNISAAESIIRDVDYAEESANFNKQNIISQAGSYAISQANTVQQNVLKLLQ